MRPRGRRSPALGAVSAADLVSYLSAQHPNRLLSCRADAKATTQLRRRLTTARSACHVVAKSAVPSAQFAQ